MKRTTSAFTRRRFLAASAAGGGPGPLITALTSRYASKVTVPMTIVPGTMDDEALERVT